MKSLLALLFTVPFLATSQGDSVFIRKYVDDMSDKVYFMTSRRLVVLDESQKAGFKLELNIHDDLTPGGIAAKLINVGPCQENDELILMFQDSSKIKLKAWNPFNCDGAAYFTPTREDYTKLRKLRVIKAMIKNGRSYESVTSKIDLKHQDYFMQSFYALDNKKIVITKE